MIAPMQLTRAILALSMIVLGSSLRADDTVQTEKAPVPISRATIPYVVGVLDRITVKHKDDSVENLVVAQDGSITLGDKAYQAKGLTPAEVGKLVRRHDADVASVQVEEYRQPKVSVLGEVYHQIFTDMNDGPMRVLDAIAAANGFTPLANTRRVKLVRENAGHVEIYELDLRRVVRGEVSSENILLKPGDVITVPRNFL